MKPSLILALLLSLSATAQPRSGGITETKLACRPERITSIPFIVELTVRRTSGVSPEYNSNSAMVTSVPAVGRSRAAIYNLTVKTQNALMATFENKKENVVVQYDKTAKTAELTLGATNYTCK